MKEIILAIESSCDETAASVVEAVDESLTVRSNIIASQINIHQQYGGVIPEIAARQHCLNIIEVIDEALTQAGIDRQKAPTQLSAIAVTAGPGLITSLMVGVETARSLAAAWQLPTIAVNHIAGHIYSGWLSGQPIEFPCVIMTVSGGHNLLVLMKSHLNYQIIGDTKDDAAGEAFDKAAKILGLGYPGGPAIAQAAGTSGDKQLPRPMLHSGDFHFSFSGLKTALLYQVQKSSDREQSTAEYAAEFQQAVVDIITKKTLAAANHYQAKTIILSGGVSANQKLRQTLTAAAQAAGQRLVITPLLYTTDNAAMIGAAAVFYHRAGRLTPWQKLTANPTWSINSKKL